MSARIESINISAEKGTRKLPVASAVLAAGHGLAGDGHAGEWHRQVSLLARESIGKMRAAGLDVGPGDFAENITTIGIDLMSLPVGTRFHLGEAMLEVSQHGKECHAPCEIFKQAGDCVMPTEGIFAVVITGGEIHVGDPVLSVAAGSGDRAAGAGTGTGEAADGSPDGTSSTIGAPGASSDAIPGSAVQPGDAGSALSGRPE